MIARCFWEWTSQGVYPIAGGKGGGCLPASMGLQGKLQWNDASGTLERVGLQSPIRISRIPSAALVIWFWGNHAVSPISAVCQPPRLANRLLRRREKNNTCRCACVQRKVRRQKLQCEQEVFVGHGGSRKNSNLKIKWHS